MNKSGYNPLDLRVLVKVDEVDEYSEGGILLTESTKENDEMKQVTGTLIAMGENAFEELTDKPEVGTKLVFGKFNGWYTTGNDGENYRILNDKDIIAIKE